MPNVTVVTVQLDYQPAYVGSGRDYLGDFSRQTPDDKYDDLTDLREKLALDERLQTRQFIEDIQAWEKIVRKAYVEWHRFRIDAILDHIENTSNADIIVFPEYSIPCELVSHIQQKCESYCVVAGSHTIRACCNDNHSEIYSVEEGDFGKACCPIVTKKGQSTIIHKKKRSLWERGLIESGVWGPMKLQHCILLGHICMDFVTDEPIERISVIQEKYPDSLLIHAVTALTPVTTDFQQKAKTVCIRPHHILLFSNCATYGGSKIYYDNTISQTFQEDAEGTIPAGSGEEIISIASIEFGVTTTSGKMSPISRTNYDSEESYRIPIYYQGDSAVDEALSLLDSENLLSSIAANAVPQLFAPAGTDSSTLKMNLNTIKARFGDLTSDEIRGLSNVLRMPAHVLGFKEWRYLALCATAKKLGELSNRAGAPRELEEYSRRYAERASSVALSREIRPVVEELSGVQRLAEWLIGRNASVVTNILAMPSSGSSLSALLEWLLAGLSNALKLEELEEVIRVSYKLRPYPMCIMTTPLIHILESDKYSDIEKRELLIAKCKEHLEIVEEERKRLVAVALTEDFPRRYERILIYGYSPSILAIFRAYAEQGELLVQHVSVAECRNLMGIDSAPDQIARLGRLGLKCSWVASESLGRLFSEVTHDALIFGANAIVPKGIVNTMGTLTAVTLAEKAGIDRVVVALSHSKWPSEMWNEENDTVMAMQRRWADRIPNWMSESSDVTKVSYAYDIVPFKYITNIITDKGEFMANEFSSGSESNW